MTNLSKNKNSQHDVDWNTVHSFLQQYHEDPEHTAHYGNAYYDYFVKYCTVYGTGFNFTDEFIEFGNTRSNIDLVHDECSYFQHSTVQDFHDLTYTEIAALKEIYIVLRGEPF